MQIDADAANGFRVVFNLSLKLLKDNACDVDKQFLSLQLIEFELQREAGMANLQIRLDDSLKEQAQAVIQDMGLDLSGAIRIFLAQVVKENGLPFRPTNEPFYSAKNQEALRSSAAQIERGQTVTKSMDELRSME